ncbi:hypothetical protein SAMN03080617_02180 [Algoriphagus alkaliphilus]|uniref:Uncharacterized protein n=1 Tax=Algoriphagus alkaliphilus TaxID=279824 RepID=A0A1G5Y250_9BACT|nr:hypothetical protein SAMN03080617_02180 [Algoriphagus alkaliphilus]
MFCFSVSIAT